MKRQFDNKIFLAIIIAAVLVGFGLYNVAGQFEMYVIYGAAGFFGVATIIYSLILGRLDKVKPLDQENARPKEKQEKEKLEVKSSTYSLFLTDDEVRSATVEVEEDKGEE